MIVSVAWDPMFLICAIVVVATIISATVILTWAIIDAKRSNLPRCGDCFYCKPIPKNAGGYFLSTERQCALHRGDNTLSLDGQPVSVVTENEYCSSFIHKDRMEDAYV